MHTLPCSRNNLDERGNFARCRTINPPVKKPVIRIWQKSNFFGMRVMSSFRKARVKTEDKLTYRQKKGWALALPRI